MALQENQHTKDYEHCIFNLVVLINSEKKSLLENWPFPKNWVYTSQVCEAAVIAEGNSPIQRKDQFSVTRH